VTPFARFLRDAFEKAFGTFHEGPTPPARLRLLVIEFLNANPHRLTRAMVLEFGTRLAETCYRAGYVRGWESTARDPHANWRRLPPELVADLEDPDWRWRPALGEQLANPEDFVEDVVAAAPIDLAGHARNRPPDE